MKYIPYAYSESILSLDVYFRIRPNLNNQDELESLSKYCRKIQFEFFDVEEKIDFRKPSALLMKLKNYASLDSTIDVKGLKNLRKDDKRLFEIYSNNRNELSIIAKRVKRAVDLDDKEELLTIEKNIEKFLLTETKTQTGKGSYSWKLLDDGKVIKILDKSSFTQNETPIDKKFGYFFNFDDNTSSSNITISHKSHTYDVALKRRAKGSTSMRMTWGSEFGEVLKGFFKGWETREAYDGIEGMKLQFTQLGEENSYKVDMIPVGSFADSAIQFDESVDNLYGTLKEVPEGQKNPESNEKTITVYKRDPEVKASVLQSAKGYCELCEDKAFLKSKNNIPYLEVHHLRKLSDNGSDTVTNAVAICANCHRKLHYANNRDELLNDLYNKVSRLVRE